VRLVVQRVSRAAVRVAGERVGEIGLGAVVLVGIGPSDDDAVVDRMADKLIGLRYFEDAAARTNLDAASARAAYLVVSQFTLYADVRSGRRPGFSQAAPPELAEPLVQRFASRLAAAGARVETGRFGTAMELELVNAGPFTLVIDSERDLGGPAG
jgi:D-aminoacyl-tRNA deacylase